jgi:O-antigen ligase/tetratricopeptide (TPR) repeat protein
MPPPLSPEVTPYPSRSHIGCEIMVGVTACLAPWAFGSVDAWAECGLVVCVTVLAVLTTITRWRSGESSRLMNAPGLAIAGLAILAWFQTVPLPASVYRRLDPGGYAHRSELVPTTASQRVRGDDDDSPVAPPYLTLSQDRDATLRTAVELSSTFILFQCIVSLGGGYAAIRRFGLAVTVNACALTLFALVQALTWKGKIYGIRPSPIPHAWYSGGPFVSYHHLAAYLNFGLGFALAFALGGGRSGPARTGQKVDRMGRHGISPLALYATGLIAVGVIASHSRGGFLAMAVAAAVLLLTLRRQPVRVWIGMTFVLSFTGLFLVVIGSASTLERLSTIWESSQSGFNGRSEIWTTSLRAWLANPVWGLGLGCFPQGAAPFYQFVRDSLYFHAENDYLEVLAEGGFLGFGLALVAFASIARLGYRAFVSASTIADRTIVMGGLFGLVALAVKASADFPLRIPGVAVTAVVLCAYLSRIGLDGSDRVLAPDAPPRPAPIKTRLGLSGLAVLCVPLVWLSYRQARCEIALVQAGIPLPGTQWLTADFGRLPIGELEKIEVTLEKILRDRPDWSEGHLRLGMTYLSHYEQTTAEWAEAAGRNPSTALMVANPLWLHALIHSGTKSEAEINELIEEDPVWLFLIPAARSFLEARRCCPFRSLPHVWLASLDYLIESGEATSVHARRGLEQSGNDIRIMAVIARAAVQAGDLELAAQCWRKSLDINSATTDDIALIAGKVLSPTQILSLVLPDDGAPVIRFVDLLYTDLASKPARELFLDEAIKRADRDTTQARPERLWRAAQALARKGQPEPARKRMEDALAEEPTRAGWRDEYVAWLIRWGDAEEAFSQATIGVNLAPSQSGPRAALERATEARNRSRLQSTAHP